MDYPKSVPGVGLVAGKFVDENTATGQQGSLIPSGWGNSVTEELINVIRESGTDPQEGELDQLVRALFRNPSEIKRGMPYVATPAEAKAGVDASKIVVPSVLKAVMSQSGSQIYPAAGTYVFQVPDVVKLGFKLVRVRVRGGGGAGGSPVNGWAGKVGGGGGQGGYSEALISLAGIATVSVVVGASGIPAPGAGTSGGTSSFGAYLSATGGAPALMDVTGGGAGAGYGGALNLRGVPGGHASASANTASNWVIQGPGGGNASGSLGAIGTIANGLDGEANGMGGNGGTGIGALGGRGGVGFVSIDWR